MTGAAPREPDAARRREEAASGSPPRWQGALLALAVVAFTGFAWLSPQGIASDDPYRDNDWFTDRAFDLLARQGWLEHGELPLRSHLLGGGFPTIGHPFDGSWSPTLLPVLAFGDVYGVKVNIAVLLLVGAWGMHGLARRWLQLEPAPSALATLAFAWSGWLPSMLLVGFYPQVFYCLAPAILRLLWVEGRAPFGPRAALACLGAGALWTLALLQAGNGFLAMGIGLGLFTWVRVAGEVGRTPWQRWGLPLLWLLAFTAPHALFRASGQAAYLLGWGLALAGLGLPSLRRFGRALLPWVGRAALVVAVAASLGAGKLVALDQLFEQGEYHHRLSPGWELWFPDDGARLLRDPLWLTEERPPTRDSDFYNSAPELIWGLLWRAPKRGEYAPFVPPDGVPGLQERPLGEARREYLWLGLTPPLLLVAGWGLTRRRELAVAFVLVAGVVLGPHLAPDLFFLLVRGLPGGDGIVQPVKYFNFFLLLLLALGAGLGLQDGLQRARLRWPGLGSRRTALIAAALLLVWPLLHNGPALAERFAHPVSAAAAPFHQLALIGHPDWVELADHERAYWGRQTLLRELARPELAREYWGALRGVGIIDWYGTVTMPEHAVPARFVTPSGELVDNPAYPGAEVWFSGTTGRVESVSIAPNRLEARVFLQGSGTVVFNQNTLPGWQATGGELRDEAGLVGVYVAADGGHRVTLTYRPARILAGLRTSAVAALFWVVVAAALASRLRSRAAATSRA